MHYLEETHIFLFLLQLLILMGSARGLGELFRRWKQPALTAEILVGVLLGPTILGRFLPEMQMALFPPDAIQQSMLETVAWIGVLFLLLDTGLEIDFSIAWRQRGNAMVIAISDIVLPMVISFVAVVFLPSRYMVDPSQRIVFALFMATVMTISAMPVAARVLHELKLLKTEMGYLTMSALAVNDIIGWVIFTIILGIFTHAQVALGPIVVILGATVGFAALALTVGRRLSTKVFDAVAGSQLPEPATSLTITVLLGLAFGAITQHLGIHALFGFFIAGVVVGEAKSLTEQTRGIISQMVHSLFVPLFFANIGLKIDFLAHFDVPLVLLMTVVGIAGRYAGAWVGVSCTRILRSNRNLISVAHTPGGMMEIVVALLALESGLITPQVFVAIVFSAVFSSVILGPWMSVLLERRKTPRLPKQLLRSDCMLTDLGAVSRSGAIEQLAACIAQRLGGNHEADMVHAAMMREQEFGTAIGDGVSIPHLRMDGLQQPCLAYGRSVDGIEWDAPDGKPVHHVFFLASPADAADLHIQILAAISKYMANAENRQLLADAPDAETLREALVALIHDIGMQPGATGRK